VHVLASSASLNHVHKLFLRSFFGEFFNSNRMSKGMGGNAREMHREMHVAELREDRKAAAAAARARQAKTEKLRPRLRVLGKRGRNSWRARGSLRRRNARCNKRKRNGQRAAARLSAASSQCTPAPLRAARLRHAVLAAFAAIPFSYVGGCLKSAPRCFPNF